MQNPNMLYQPPVSTVGTGQQLQANQIVMPGAQQTAVFGKKARKPYTITKQREAWTEEEHQKFLEALKLYDRDWSKIEQYIGTKTAPQIRSHAQKYFLKVQKNQTGEHVPPPRPKRRSMGATSRDAPYDPNLASLAAINPFLGSPALYSQWLVDGNRVSPGSGMSNGMSSGLSPGSAMGSGLNSAPEKNSEAEPLTSNTIPPPHTSSIDALAVAPSTPSTSAAPSTLISPPPAQPAVQLSTPQQVSDPQQEIFLQAQPFLHQIMEQAVAQHQRQNQTSETANFARIYAFLAGMFELSAAAHLEAFQHMSSIEREIVKSMTHMLAMSLARKQYQPQQAQMLDQYRNLMQKTIVQASQPKPPTQAFRSNSDAAEPCTVSTIGVVHADNHEVR